MNGSLIVLIVVLFVPAFVALWCGVCYLLSQVAGWPRLRELYRFDQPFQGPTLSFSGRMGATNYKGVLVGGANTEGLYLNVPFPFNVGTGPLFIPWREITVSQADGWLMKYVAFEFPKGATKLLVAERVATRLLAWRDGGGR